MNTGQIIVAVLSVIGILIMLYIMAMLDKHKAFEKYLKEGDRVDWYLGESRETYILERHGKEYSEIRNFNGTLRKVRTKELLPNFWYKYGV